MNEFIRTSLDSLFKRSPSIDLFEYIWVPELRKECMCIGYFWYSDEQKLIYAIAEETEIKKQKFFTKHYIEAEDFRRTGFHQYEYRATYKPKHQLFKLVRLGVDTSVHMVCGLEYNPMGWVYHVDRNFTPYCSDELEAFFV